MRKPIFGRVAVLAIRCGRHFPVGESTKQALDEEDDKEPEHKVNLLSTETFWPKESEKPTLLLFGSHSFLNLNILKLNYLKNQIASDCQGEKNLPDRIFDRSQRRQPIMNLWYSPKNHHRRNRQQQLKHHELIVSQKDTFGSNH